MNDDTLIKCAKIQYIEKRTINTVDHLGSNGSDLWDLNKCPLSRGVSVWEVKKH